jgi:hypothetical protein
MSRFCSGFMVESCSKDTGSFFILYNNKRIISLNLPEYAVFRAGFRNTFGMYIYGKCSNKYFHYAFGMQIAGVDAYYAPKKTLAKEAFFAAS